MNAILLLKITQVSLVRLLLYNVLVLGVDRVLIKERMAKQSEEVKETSKVNRKSYLEASFTGALDTMPESTKGASRSDEALVQVSGNEQLYRTTHFGYTPYNHTHGC